MGDRDAGARRAAERMSGARSIARRLPDGRLFDVAYVRTGPTGGPTVLMVPGGPGLASVLPYPVVRAIAAAKGLDVLMVEHRGVGLSRRDQDGLDLPSAALTIEDAVADLVAVRRARPRRVRPAGADPGDRHQWAAAAAGRDLGARRVGAALDRDRDGRAQERARAGAGCDTWLRAV